MTDQPLPPAVERPATWHRRPAFWLLALICSALAAPLLADGLALARDPRTQPWAWSAGTGWAVVVLGAAIGLLAALLLRSRWPRLGVVVGAGVLAAAVLVAAYRTLPGAAFSIPGCGPALPLDGAWQLHAETSVDGQPRETLTVDVPSVDEAGAPLLGGLLDDLRAVAVEDVGIEIVDGDSVYARHCRALVSGSQVSAALPFDSPRLVTVGPLVPARLPVWRGDLDWWVSDAGALVGARFRVGGHPADAWPDADGNQGQLTVELWPVELAAAR